MREGANRYREENAVKILPTLRSPAINVLSHDGIWSINKGNAGLAHDIKLLISLLGWRELIEEQP